MRITAWIVCNSHSRFLYLASKKYRMLFEQAGNFILDKLESELRPDLMLS